MKTCDLGHEAHVGMLLLDAGGDGDDFLDELAPDQRRDEPRAGAGEEDAIGPGGETGLDLHPPQELDDLLGLLGVVALIVLPGDLAILDDGGLDGGRADVDADELHETRRPIFRATCRTVLAAVPHVVLSCGMR
jgi:hypothetical protein